jgi:hypothetical protein
MKREAGNRRHSRSSLGLVTYALEHRSSTRYGMNEEQTSITCRVCGFTSTNPRHVRDRYCPKCRVFHEDRTLMERLAEGYSKVFESEAEEVSRLRPA